MVQFPLIWEEATKGFQSLCCGGDNALADVDFCSASHSSSWIRPDSNLVRGKFVSQKV